MRVRLTAGILVLAGLLVAVAVGLAANSIASRSFTPGVDALPSAGSLAPPATNRPTAPKATTRAGHDGGEAEAEAEAEAQAREAPPAPAPRPPAARPRATITAGAATAPEGRAAARAAREATAAATGVTTSETLTDSLGVAYQRLTSRMTG